MSIASTRTSILSRGLGLLHLLATEINSPVLFDSRIALKNSADQTNSSQVVYELLTEQEVDRPPFKNSFILLLFISRLYSTRIALLLLLLFL